MRLAEPYWLLLVLAVPLVLRWWPRSSAPALPFPDLGLVPASASLDWIPWASRGGRWGVMLLLILAAAQPQWPDRTTRLPAQAAVLGLVLDVSGSMAETDFLHDGQARTRLEAAQEMLTRLVRGDGEALKGRADDLIALVTFAAHVEDLCPPTLSHGALLQLVQQVEAVGAIPDNTTNIGDALVLAVDLVRRASPARPCLVLLSDGEHNVRPEVVPRALRPRQAARIAAALGVRIHTILITGPASATSELTQREQEEAARAMADVAAITGGQAFRAGDANTLLELARQIDALERAAPAAPDYGQWHELYPFLLVAGLVLLVLTIAFECSFRRMLP
ncbi:MAG TPA: VWA domain-containing protein [Gemmatales bacterium]|nr:VWA domain-containing protein [Gemmatales bacterium]HMP59698.1 VWA domain-containing protein [Gemmatales bacterium]